MKSHHFIPRQSPTSQKHSWNKAENSELHTDYFPISPSAMMEVQSAP